MIFTVFVLQIQWISAYYVLTTNRLGAPTPVLLLNIAQMLSHSLILDALTIASRKYSKQYLWLRFYKYVEFRRVKHGLSCRTNNEKAEAFEMQVQRKSRE